MHLAAEVFKVTVSGGFLSDSHRVFTHFLVLKNIVFYRCFFSCQKRVNSQVNSRAGRNMCDFHNIFSCFAVGGDRMYAFLR